MPEMTDDNGEIIQTPFIRTQYNYNRDAVSLECGHANNEPTMTQQQFRDECDINTILDRFGVTGMVPTNVRQPLAMDFVEATDYQSALNALIEAEQSFMEMPAKIRAEFDNDPGKFITFFEHEENRERAIQLGLIQKPAETPTQGAVPPPVPPTPGAS